MNTENVQPTKQLNHSSLSARGSPSSMRIRVKRNSKKKGAASSKIKSAMMRMDNVLAPFGTGLAVVAAAGAEAAIRAASMPAVPLPERTNASYIANSVFFTSRPCGKASAKLSLHSFFNSRAFMRFAAAISLSLPRSATAVSSPAGLPPPARSSQCYPQ